MDSLKLSSKYIEIPEDSPTSIKKKIASTLKIRNMMMYVFLAYLIGSATLTLDFPTLIFSFLGVLFLIGAVIHCRLYYLYKKVGRGRLFLKKRGAIILFMIILLTVGYIFII